MSPAEKGKQKLAIYEAAIEPLAHLTLEGTTDKWRLSLGGIYAPEEGTQTSRDMKNPLRWTLFSPVTRRLKKSKSVPITILREGGQPIILRKPIRASTAWSGIFRKRRLRLCRPDKRKIRKTGCPAKGSLFPLKGGFAIADKEITLKLYSPLTGDFHENEIDEYGWNNGVSDYPTLFDGTDMVCYEESIRPAVEQYTGNLMSYFYKQRNPGIKEKVISAIPSIEIRNGELMGCTTVVLKEPLADEEMEDLQDYLHGQFSDGWGEGFEQQEIQTDDGVLYVHFGEAEPFYFEVEQMQPAEPLKEQLPPHRPKMKLVGQDGNIFSILGRASRLLKENGQPDQAKEMCDRVYQSGNYYKALNIISEYVETELSEKTHTKSKNEKERGDAR